MTYCRRPLALSALVILLLQVSGLIAGPMSDGCRSMVAKASVCCKAAEHQSGPCPMHVRAGTGSDQCRMGCDRRDEVPVLLGIFAFLPAGPSIGAPIVEPTILRSTTAIPVVRTITPDSPPPEARV